MGGIPCAYVQPTSEKGICSRKAGFRAHGHGATQSQAPRSLAGRPEALTALSPVVRAPWVDQATNAVSMAARGHTAV